MSHELDDNFIASGHGTQPIVPSALAVPTLAAVEGFVGFLPPMSNTTYTPNQFFDVCLPHCSRSALRLVGYFLRRTLGWCDQYGKPQEEQIKISFRELATKSGVGRDRLRAALDEAIAGHFIECLREGRPHLAHSAGQSALYRLCWHDVPEYHKKPADFRGFFEREGNRTDIPNQFFDFLVPTESLAVIKVVGAVIRSSIGFAAGRGARRQWAALSYTQIQNFTHLKDRGDLARAVRTALARGYIVRLAEGIFTHENAEQRAAVYALRWSDGWSENRVGPKNPPGKVEPDRSEIPTTNDPKNPPVERSEIPTSIKMKQINETGKQQQEEEASPALELLRKEGFSEGAARELAERVPLEVIHRQVGWLPRRRPARSRLGMLRRAMEQDWPEPSKVGTSGLSAANATADTRELVRHFYAGYHTNSGEPVAEPSASECALAQPLATRLVKAGAKPGTLADWGRALGKLAREQPNPVPSFPLALRQVGDRLCADAEDTLRRRRFFDRELERVAHRNRWRPVYDTWLRQEERRLRAEQPEECAQFDTARSEERRRLFSKNSDWIAALLEQFDAEAARREQFRRFFRLPDYETWEAEHHPYLPNQTT